MEKGDPNAPLVGVETGAAIVGSSMEIPRKIKDARALWPSNFTSRNLSEETRNTNSKEHKHPYVHCSVIYNCQDMETVQVSINRTNKTTMGHSHNGILLSCKKEENFILCNNMGKPGEHYAK